MKKEKIEEVNKSEEEKTSFMFKVLGYKVYGTKRQYVVFKIDENKKGKGGKVIENFFGYYSWLEHALSAIRQDGLRFSTVGSKTLDIAIERLTAFNEEFNRLIAPLKKLEDL